MQQDDLTTSSGDVWMPATFKGTATIQGDDERLAPLTTSNIRLTPADRCPAMDAD